MEGTGDTWRGALTSTAASATALVPASRPAGSGGGLGGGGDRGGGGSRRVGLLLPSFDGESAGGASPAASSSSESDKTAAAAARVRSTDMRCDRGRLRAAVRAQSASIAAPAPVNSEALRLLHMITFDEFIHYCEALRRLNMNGDYACLRLIYNFLNYGSHRPIRFRWSRPNHRCNYGH